MSESRNDVDARHKRRVLYAVPMSRPKLIREGNQLRYNLFSDKLVTGMLGTHTVTSLILMEPLQEGAIEDLASG